MRGASRVAIKYLYTELELLILYATGNISIIYYSLFTYSLILYLLIVQNENKITEKGEKLVLLTNFNKRLQFQAI